MAKLLQLTTTSFYSNYFEVHPQIYAALLPRLQSFTQMETASEDSEVESTPEEKETVTLANTSLQTTLSMYSIDVKQKNAWNFLQDSESDAHFDCTNVVDRHGAIRKGRFCNLAVLEGN